MIDNNYDFKCETSYKVPFDITQCWTNGMVTLNRGAIKLGIIYVALSHMNLIQTLKTLNFEKYV